MVKYNLANVEDYLCDIARKCNNLIRYQTEQRYLIGQFDNGPPCYTSRIVRMPVF